MNNSAQNAATASGVCGAIVAVALWVAQVRYPEVRVPPEIAAALATIVGALAAWAGSRF
jgi:hypothetical protein